MQTEAHIFLGPTNWTKYRNLEPIRPQKYFSFWQDVVWKSYVPHVVTVTPHSESSMIIDNMQTQSSPSQSIHSDSDGALWANTDPAKAPVHWSAANETAFIDFLIAHKAEAGNSLNFKPSVWTAAAEHMQLLTTKGGPKHAEKCKAKWGRVHHIYFYVSLLSPNAMPL